MLDYAREQGADVVNVSFTVNNNVYFSQAVQRAVNAGMVLIASSGNEGTGPGPDPARVTTCPFNGTYPSSASGVLAIGAILTDNTRWSSSCPSGPGGVDEMVMAPGGEHIIPTTNRSTSNQPYVLFDGTSAAAPQVAGIAALILSVNPGLTASQVYEAITETADPTGCISVDPSISDARECGQGLVDAYAALVHVLENYGGTLAQDVTIPAGETWNLGNVTLAFAPGKRLIVDGTLNAHRTTFTASDPALGWGGIRFDPGASGTLTGTSADRLVVENVAGIENATVYVHNASVSFSNVLLDGREQQPSDYDLQVHAVWATGSSASVSVSRTEIDPHSGGGIVAAAGATVFISDNTLLSGDGVFAWGYGGASDVYTYDQVVADGSAQAQTYATTWLGPPDYGFDPVLPNNTFHASASYIGTTSATNHGEVFASDFGGGQGGTGHHNNHLFGQSTGSRGYAEAEVYSVVDAAYNWWGSTSGPDLGQSSVDGGSSFSYCPHLTSPTSGAAACGGGGGSPPPKGEALASSEALTASVDGRPDRSALGRARVALAAGDRATAAAGLRDALTEAVGRPAVRRRALGLAARLASRADDSIGRSARQSLLDRLDTPDRPWALRALAVAEAGQGRHEAVLGLAADLVAEGGEHAVAGLLAESLARSALGEPEAALAALAEATRLAPGDPDAVMVRNEIALRYAVERPDLLEAASAVGAGFVAARSTAANIGDAPATELSLGLPHPNPTRGAVTVPLALPNAATVRATVHDVLGREVSVLHDGPLGEGAHRVTLSPEAAQGLSPGLHLLRVLVTEDGGEARMLSGRLTVVR